MSVDRKGEILNCFDALRNFVKGTLSFRSGITYASDERVLVLLLGMCVRVCVSIELVNEWKKKKKNLQNLC